MSEQKTPPAAPERPFVLPRVPRWRSLLRSFALAKELGIGQIRMVANKVRSPRDEDIMREYTSDDIVRTNSAG